MAHNNNQLENLHAFLVRSYIQHMNESMNVITQSLTTIRRQDAAYNQMINDTITLLNIQRDYNMLQNNRLTNNNIQNRTNNRNNSTNNNTNNNTSSLNMRSRRTSTLFEPNLWNSIDPYRQYYSTTTRRNTTRNFYNNMRNFWNQLNNNNTNGFTLNLDFNDFQDVVISPTTEEINVATHIIRYGNIIQPQNSTCPISLTPFEDNTQVMRIRYCGHLFIPDELQTWFQQNVRCPLCRYDIRNYSHNTNTNLTTNNFSNVNNNNNENNENNNDDSDDETIIQRNSHEMIHNENNGETTNEATNEATNEDNRILENNNTNENVNNTNMIHNSDGSLVFTRNIVGTSIDELQNELQNLFADMNSSILHGNIRQDTNTNNMVPNGLNIQDISNNN